MQEKKGKQNGPVTVSRLKYPFAETAQRVQEAAELEDIIKKAVG